MKKLCLMFISIFMIGINSYSQELIPNQNDKGKWGYVDGDGNVVINYQYDEASFFLSGRAKVRKGDNFGYINEENKTIIPIKYNTIDVYNSNIYKVSAGGNYKDGVLFNEKYGFIDFNGVEILKPEYNEIGLFTDGIAYIKKGDLYGYINDSIRVIIPCKFKAVGKFNKEGFVWVNEGCSFEKNSTSKIKDGKFGIYDKTGKIILPAKFKTAGIFVPFVYTYSDAQLNKLSDTEKKIYTEGGTHKLLRKWLITSELFSKLEDNFYGFWGSQKNDGCKNSVVSKDGTIIIPDNKYQHAFYPEEGFSVIKEKYTYNFINVETGEKLLDTNVSEAWAFQNGKAVIKDNGFYLIDKTGKKTTQSYTNIFPCKENVYIVSSSNGYGILDINGNEIISPSLYSIYPSSNGLMRVQSKENGLIGYINASGKYIVPEIYKNGQSFKFGYASVCSANGWGEINNTGKEVVKSIWNNTKNKSVENPQYLWVQPKNNSLWYCIDMRTDKYAFSNGYNWCRNFNSDLEEIAIVGKDDNNLGCIDTKGNVIIPLEMPNYDVVIDAYNKFKESGKKKWEEIDSYRIKIYNNDKRNDFNLYNTIDDSLWDY